MGGGDAVRIAPPAPGTAEAFGTISGIFVGAIPDAPERTRL